MEIVVGYQGAEHVTAAQMGRIVAGMAGDGTYVLGTQNGLAATMQTANQVRIDTGDLVMHGRVATVETPETLTIESGVTGQKRNDIVVARYTKNASSSVEACTLAVVKGTPVSYGDPSDPELSDGSILDGDSPVEVPLWRITLDGLAPGTPEKLFEEMPSMDAVRDSLSRYVDKTFGPYRGSPGYGQGKTEPISDLGFDRAPRAEIVGQEWCTVSRITSVSAESVSFNINPTFESSGIRVTMRFYEV